MRDFGSKDLPRSREVTVPVAPMRPSGFDSGSRRTTAAAHASSGLVGGPVAVGAGLGVWESVLPGEASGSSCQARGHYIACAIKKGKLIPARHQSIDNFKLTNRSAQEDSTAEMAAGYVALRDGREKQLPKSLPKWL